MRNSIMLGLLLALSGCGAIYKSPAISTQTVSQTPVRVVAISGENLLLANSSPYRPKTLPAVFNQTAGTGSGLASMPMNPQGAMMAQPRPGAIETRLPPKVKHSPYRIGIGDVVVVATQGGYLSGAGASDPGAAADTRRGYTVQDDGAVAIPNVGRVRIAHMTVDQAEAALFQTFVANQIDPTFSLEVAEFNAHRVSIGGAVANPAIAACRGLHQFTLFISQAQAQPVNLGFRRVGERCIRNESEIFADADVEFGDVFFVERIAQRQHTHRMGDLCKPLRRGCAHLLGRRIIGG